MFVKRRLLIFGTALALYVALIAVIWAIGTRQAAQKTESQLDFALLDFHDTVAGAIDTMLGHVAATAVRHIGKVQALPREKMVAVADEYDIDEVNIVSREGVIVASNDPTCPGTVMAGNPVMDPFMDLTNGVTATVSQPFRTSTRNAEFRAKYLGAAFPGGDGFVQVGLAERRLAKMLPTILGYIFDQWLLGNTGFFLCADMETGRLISNPSRHRDQARTLQETGYDVKTASRYEVILDGKVRGRTFVQRLFGEKCYCRAYRFGGHRFVAALPAREFYSTRSVFVGVFGVLFFGIIAAFAFFIDRIFRDSDRLKAFYAAEDARRAKDMEIAKTIQTAALPPALPETLCYRLDAAMQAARNVGGDFYDNFALDATHIAFLVADVSGKGVTAALYMMTAKTLIKDTLLALHDPAAAFTKVNAELCENNPANMFLTAWVGVLDLETGVLSFANAGHNPPAFIAAAGGGASFVTEKSGPVLAFMDGISYKSCTMRIVPGDALFLYTDGVTEALDAKSEFFGEERLVAALNAAPSNPRSLCTVVRAAVAAFSEGVPQADDITVLAIRYLAPPRTHSCSFPPTREGTAAASDWLDETVSALSVTNPRVAALTPTLHIITDEIASNIVRYSGASGFELDITQDDDELRLVFIDDGSPYDPLSAPSPDITLGAADRPIGGLGVLMVKKMSDSVSYRRAHNRNFLTITKHL